MAQNIQTIADIAIAEAAIALRNHSIMPLLVSRDLDVEAAKKNKIIQVPIWHKLPVQSVTPGRGNENTPTDLTPDTVDITLDQWKEVRFALSDKEMAEIEEGRVLPAVMKRAVHAHADAVDLYLLGLMYKASFSYEINTAPTAVADVIGMRTAMNKEKCPRDAFRRLVVSDDVEGEMLLLSAFHEVDKVGDTDAIRNGSLGAKFGFSPIVADGQMPSHTQGDAATRTVNGAHASEESYSGGTSTLATTGGTGSLLAGDLITLGGGSQSYVCVTDEAAGSVEIAPKLRTAMSGGEAIAYAAAAAGADHAIGGLGFHEGALALATRPLQSAVTPGVIISQATDPLSGLSLRVTVEYVNKELEWSLDILYGAAVIYPEMIARLVD
jgi:hypothetical protein